MSVPDASPAPAAQLAAGLDEEAAALAADILPVFTSAAAVHDIWSHDRVDSIARRRTQIHGHKLFFDELLSFASIDPALYPPRSDDQLAALLRAIFNATSLDYLKQLSLVYYLLLDLDARSQSHGQNQGAADRFADTYVVLPQFTDAMNGYWLLDNDEYDRAIPFLAIADFIPKIVRTLFVAPDADARTEVARAKLLLRFLRTSSQPTSSAPGSEPFLQEVEMRIQALCLVSGPSRAFVEIRALTSAIHDDEARRVAIRARLIFKVLEHCFAPPRPAAIRNLLACSLDAEEEVTLESFVLAPPPAMTATWSYAAADVLIVRYISQGRYMDAVGLDRRLGPDVSQGHSGAKDAQQRSKMMEQRKRMIAGAREILPEVQKELLRIEESVEISGTGAGTAKQGQPSPSADDPTPTVKHDALDDVSIRSARVPTPLTASPAARRSAQHTPSTQAAILSAVVRASASPSAANTPSRGAALNAASPSGASINGTPGRRSASPHPAAMLGFLAKNALSGTRSGGDSADAASADEAMDDETELDGSAVLVARPGDTDKVASPTPTAQPASPWRNQPSLTSSSPFSGLPKLPRGAMGGVAAGSVASGSRSPYQGSPRGFQPASTSPFAASTRSSPTVPTRSKLGGALALVSQHGKKSRLGRDTVEVESDSDADADVVEQSEDGADDTFVQRSQSKADVSIGRLVPGRRGWNEAVEVEGEAQPPAKRRSRKEATPSKARMTRSRTGLQVDPSTAGGLSKSRTETALAGKRTTRSTSAANRKPLTLSNLEQHERQDEAALPIARRTRAATAELESVNGSQADAAPASTIYTISEAGDADAKPSKSSKRAPAARGGVRRSNRLSSVEPEAVEMSEVSSPAKRRGGARRTLGTKMPGSLE